jgi:hypothetical protein
VQDAGQFAAGADAELDEDLAQMPFDRARAEKQLGADLGVGAAIEGAAGDLPLLRGELVGDLTDAEKESPGYWPGLSLVRPGTPRGDLDVSAADVQEGMAMDEIQVQVTAVHTACGRLTGQQVQALRRSVEQTRERRMTRR